MAGTRCMGAWVAALVLASGAGGCQKRVSDRSIKLVTIAEVRELMRERDGGRPEALLLIDPRSEREFAAGRLPGARRVPIEQVSRRREKNPEFARYSNIIVYGNDPASGLAKGMTKNLLQSGHKARMYAGGVREWLEAGYRLERDPMPDAAPDAPERERDAPAREPEAPEGDAGADEGSGDPSP